MNAARKASRAKRLLAKAETRPTWVPVQTSIGAQRYRVYPSGSVYRMEGRTAVRISGADAEVVIRRVMEEQAAGRNQTSEQEHQ